MKKYDELYEVAVSNYGLVTAKTIDELGIHLKDVLEWVKSGRLEKRGRGVYRIAHYLPTEYDTYAEAVALVGDTAMICGESVLGDPNEKKVKKILGIIDHINSLEPEFEKLSDEELRAKTQEFKEILAKRPTSDNEK